MTEHIGVLVFVLTALIAIGTIGFAVKLAFEQDQPKKFIPAGVIISAIGFASLILAVLTGMRVYNYSEHMMMMHGRRIDLELARSVPPLWMAASIVPAATDGILLGPMHTGTSTPAAHIDTLRYVLKQQQFLFHFYSLTIENVLQSLLADKGNDHKVTIDALSKLRDSIAKSRDETISVQKSLE